MATPFSTAPRVTTASTACVEGDAAEPPTVGAHPLRCPVSPTNRNRAGAIAPLLRMTKDVVGFDT